MIARLFLWLTLIPYALAFIVGVLVTVVVLCVQAVVAGYRDGRRW